MSRSATELHGNSAKQATVLTQKKVPGGVKTAENCAPPVAMGVASSADSTALLLEEEELVNNGGLRYLGLEFSLGSVVRQLRHGEKEENKAVRS